MAQRPGEQTDQTMNREVRPDSGCDIFGRQYDRNPYEKDGGTAYYDVEFQGPDNQLLPESGNYNHAPATPGEGRFRSSATDMNTRSERELMKGYNHYGPEDANKGASTYFVGPDQTPDGRYRDDRDPVLWPTNRPQSDAPDFGDQLRRNDVEGRAFRKGK